MAHYCLNQLAFVSKLSHTGVMDPEQIQAQIDFLLSALTAARALYLKLMANAAKSYNVNTGQTTESVTRQDLSSVKANIDAIITELNQLYAQQDGEGTINLVPGF